MRRREKKLEPVIYPIDRAERLAKIMGKFSAAARALAELKDRQAKGEDVVMLVQGPMILVGPPLTTTR